MRRMVPHQGHFLSNIERHNVANIQDRIDMSAEIGGHRDDAPAGEYHNENIEDAWRPLCKGIEAVEGLLLEEFGSVPQLLVEPSSMFSDL